MKAKQSDQKIERHCPKMVLLVSLFIDLSNVLSTSTSSLWFHGEDIDPAQSFNAIQKTTESCKLFSSKLFQSYKMVIQECAINKIQ